MTPTWLAARMRRCGCGTWVYRIYDDRCGLHVDIALHPARPGDTPPYYQLIAAGGDQGPVFQRDGWADGGDPPGPNTHPAHHCPPPERCRWCGHQHQAVTA